MGGAGCGSGRWGGGAARRAGLLGLRPPLALILTLTHAEGPLSPDGSTPVHWVSRAQLADARDAVSDMRFAPHHQGLRLATASSDGLVRVYEAVEPSSLAEWTVQVQFTAFSTSGGARSGVTCLAWNHSRLDPPQLVAAGSDGAVRVRGAPCVPPPDVGEEPS